jgi:hypothetical protein
LPLIGNSAGFMGSMDWEHNLQWVYQQFLCRELPWPCRKINFVLASGMSQFVTCVTQPHQRPPLVLWGSSKASRQWEDMFWMAYNHNECWKKIGKEENLYHNLRYSWLSTPFHLLLNCSLVISPILTNKSYSSI